MPEDSGVFLYWYNGHAALMILWQALAYDFTIDLRRNAFRTLLITVSESN
jgi:hypothetical protein